MKSQHQLVGRHAEKASLGDLLDQARRGQPRLAIIEGEAGVGKSRLAFSVIDQARGLGFDCHVARGQAGLSTAYLPLMSTLLPALIETARTTRNLSQHVAVLEQLLGTSDVDALVDVRVDANRARTLTAAAQAMIAMAKNTPTLIVFDDVQWSDEPTIELSVYVLQQVFDRARVERVPLAAIVTRRTSDHEPAPVALTRLEREDNTEVVHLAPFHRLEAAELLLQESPLQSMSSRSVDRIMELTGGNPLFLKTIADQLRSEADLAQGWNPTVPTEMTAAIRADIGALTDATQQSLQVASLLNVDIPVPLLALLRDVSINEQLDQLDEAVTAGVLEADPSYRFAHPLYRESCRSSLTAPRQQFLHLQIADHLSVEDTGQAATVRAVAQHLLQARSLVDNDRLRSSCTRAGHAAFSVSAWAEAAANFCAALEVIPDNVGPTEHAQLLLFAGRSLNLCGDEQQSEALFDQAIALLRAGDQPRLLGQALVYQAQRFAGGQSGARVEAQPLLDLAERLHQSEPALTASLLANAAQLLWIGGDPAKASSVALDASELALKVGAVRAYSVAGMSLAMTSWIGARVAEGLETLEKADRVVQGSQDPVARLAPLSRIPMNLVEVARFDDAMDRADQALSVARQLNYTREIGLPLAAKLGVFAARGDFVEVTRQMDGITTLSQTEGYTWTDPLTYPVLATLQSARGEWTLARAALTTWQQSMGQGSFQSRTATLVGLWMRMLEGFPGEASKHLATEARWLVDAPILIPSVQSAATLAEMAALAPADVRQAALAILNECHDRGQRFVPNRLIFVDRARGLLQAAEGNTETAVKLLTTARDQARSCNARLEHARATLDLLELTPQVTGEAISTQVEALGSELAALALFPYLERWRSLRAAHRGGHAPAAAPDDGEDNLVVMFVDTKASTLLTHQVGDTEFRSRGRPMLDLVGDHIVEAGGVGIEGSKQGDGWIATFHTVAQALACAAACHESANRYSLQIHVGIHAGEVWRERKNIWGTAVNLTSRVCDEADGGETFVTETARLRLGGDDSVALFDQGFRELRGTDEVMRLWKVASSS